MTIKNDTITTTTTTTKSPEILLPNNTNKSIKSPLNNTLNTSTNQHQHNKSETRVSPPLSPTAGDDIDGGKGSPKQKDQIANAVNSVLNGES